MLFFIPTLKDIETHYSFSKEVAADSEVIKNNCKRYLISALSKFLSPRAISFNGVAAFSTGSEDLERRLVYLTDQSMGSIQLSKLKLVVSLTVIAFLFLSLSASIHTMVMSGGMKNISYICPFGDNCIFSRKHHLNITKPINYTPVK